MLSVSNKEIKNKKSLYSQHATEKGDTTCIISKNSQSAWLEGILKQIFFTRMKSNKKNL